MEAGQEVAEGRAHALDKHFPACSPPATLTVFGPFFLPTSRGLRWADKYTEWISMMLLSLFVTCYKMKELSVLYFSLEKQLDVYLPCLDCVCVCISVVKKFFDMLPCLGNSSETSEDFPSGSKFIVGLPLNSS